MEELLDFSKDLDINLLDRIVGVFYSGTGSPAERKNADEVLKKFQEHPDAWTRADKILQESSDPNSKYIALSILDKLIQTKWKALPIDQRQGIRNFVVNMCIGWSNDDEIFRTQKQMLNKANLTLVQILKQEWPANWPNFIPEIVAASRTGLNVCENNMNILRLLSEEVFDYSSDQMTTHKIKNLKQQMCEEFAQIYSLCFEVLEKANRPSLIAATLHSLLKYLSWIPLAYVFDTPLIPKLVEKLQPPEYRNLALKCLTEIAGLDEAQYDAKFFDMFTHTVDAIHQIIPLGTDIRQIYAVAGSRDQEFIQNLALFLSYFLSHHLMLVEKQDNKDLLINVHLYLLEISKVDEREVFKGCLEYWSRLVLNLYNEIQDLPMSDLNGHSGSFANNFASAGAANPEILARLPLRKHYYASILSSLRQVMIEKMVRPEEVLIVENDEGEIVREFVKESDTITLYKSMRQVLVYLTHLDVADTEAIMSNKLARQMDGSEWSWNRLNTLCWAIGSISGAMNEEMEKRFLVNVIKELLILTDMKRGKDNKAVVASNIMYIVGQYPRFLKAHWKFLKTVINKLFEFMHETHEGVQDMACDTFIKIAQKCKRHFVAQQQGETEPFIDEIVQTLDKITSDLQAQQVQTFYEACGHILSAQAVKPTRDRLLDALMRLPNMAWDAMVRQSNEDPELLTNPENIKIIANVMKTNVATCSSLGSGFYPQLGRNYMDMLGLYRAVSKMISDSIAKDGVIAAKTPRVRGLRTIKKEILKLIETYISKADNLDEVVNDMVHPLLNAVLEDYRENVPDAREAEVLKCMNTVVSRLGTIIPEMVLQILENVFESTLDMINKDMHDYPEHRVEFFSLLRSINLNSFSALLQLPEQIFTKTLEACLWAAKHDDREVESTGLSLTYEMMNNMADLNQPEISDKFFVKFFRLIVGDVFYVMTDADHKAGFKIQSQILAKMVDLVETNKITSPLYLENEAPVGTTNSQYFRQFLAQSLINAFPHLAQKQVEMFVQSLFDLHKDQTRFKSCLRDFLVEIREYTGDETDYLYAEDKEEERLAKEKAEKEQQMKIGGLVKPSEMEEDM
ncbi:exportin-1 [Trichomonascus vanleenenianus]|uniref:exportin CRM1 n=1 Tax=Trichomonascus vanleenenianus TaxID=2268995 RepID=UPI003ECA6BD7